MHFKILSANCQALFFLLKQSIAVSLGCLLDWLKEKWYIFASYLLILLCLNKQNMFSNPFRLQWLIWFSGTWLSSLVHLMACCLIRNKPLPEPNLLIINWIFIKIQERWLNFPEGISITFCRFHLETNEFLGISIPNSDEANKPRCIVGPYMAQWTIKHVIHPT